MYRAPTYINRVEEPGGETIYIMSVCACMCNEYVHECVCVCVCVFTEWKGKPQLLRRQRTEYRARNRSWISLNTTGFIGLNLEL